MSLKDLPKRAAQLNKIANGEVKVLYKAGTTVVVDVEDPKWGHIEEKEVKLESNIYEGDVYFMSFGFGFSASRHRVNDICRVKGE